MRPSSGVATVEYNISSFSLHGTRPISGRVFAVHDPWGRSGCGVATRSYRQAARAALRPYPGQLDGGTIRASKMSGTIYFEVSSGSASLSVKGLISGLAPNSAGGWHVHSGYTCNSSNLVGGHFYPTGGADVWIASRWASDANGVAEFADSVSGYGLSRDGALRGIGGAHAVLGRTVVIHDAANVKVACGVIEPARGMPLTLSRYPGYTGSLDVRGLLLVADATQSSSGASSVVLGGTLTGLPASQSGRWHVHAGTSCTDAAGIMGTYFGGPYDPWQQAPLYTTDTQGVVQLNMSLGSTSPGSVGVLVPGYTLSRSQPVSLRAFVIHDPSGVPVACGLIGQRVSFSSTRASISIDLVPTTSAAGLSRAVDVGAGIGVGFVIFVLVPGISCLCYWAYKNIKKKQAVETPRAGMVVESGGESGGASPHERKLTRTMTHSGADMSPPSHPQPASGTRNTAAMERARSVSKSGSAVSSHDII